MTTFKPKITLFHCINTFGDADDLPIDPDGSKESFELKAVKLPCSSMIKDIYLMKAFESGSDAVAVLVCPKDACRYVEGVVRAEKRTAFIRKVLDEIGVGGDRLFLFSVPHGNLEKAAARIREVVDGAVALGPNPAA